MNLTEAKEAVERLRNDGEADECIISGLHQIYLDNLFDRELFENILDFMGYEINELNEDSLKLTKKDQKDDEINQLDESLKLFDLLKTGKCSDDEIMSIFYLQFLNGEITMETFNELMKKLGCCLIDEFINLSVEKHRETLSNIVKNNIKKNNLN